VQAAGLLFKIARGAAPPEADGAIARFLAVSDEVLPAERDGAIGATGEQRGAAAARALAMCRQQLEMALALSTPDLARAEKMLAEIPRIAELCAVSITALTDELAFRRVQIAVAKNEEPAVDSALGVLASSSSSFACAARQLALRRAVEQSRAHPGDVEWARRVAGVGEPVVRDLDASGRTDAGADSVRDEVAGAAYAIFRSSGDGAMRDLALRIDRVLYGRGARFTSSLRRLAELSGLTGDDQLALDCWNLLVSGLPETQPGWFEARYESIRLLARKDRAAAADAMRLLELAHPDLGPPVWRERMRTLRDDLLGSGAPASSAPAAPRPKGGG
jgi:hypothetical protein